MRAGGGQRCGEDAADLRARLPPEGVAGAAPQHARPHRLGHRPVQDLQGGKKERTLHISHPHCRVGQKEYVGGRGLVSKLWDSQMRTLPKLFRTSFMYDPMYVPSPRRLTNFSSQ